MRLVVVVALAGCGRCDFDAQPDARPLGPFGTPIAVTELNEVGVDDDPSLTGDMLEIYFDSTRGGLGGGDIWVATRPRIDVPFSTPLLVSELASPDDDTSPDVSLDGLTLYFSSSRVTGDRDLFVSTRANRAMSWSAPTRIEELTTNVPETSAVESADRRRLYFATSRSNGIQDIYLATRAMVGAPWLVDGPVMGISESSYGESQHWIDASETIMYVSSNRMSTGGLLHIWRSTRESRDDAFGPPELVVELTSPAEDADPWLSPDGHTIYFASTRNGQFDIFMATR